MRRLFLLSSLFVALLLAASRSQAFTVSGSIAVPNDTMFAREVSVTVLITRTDSDGFFIDQDSVQLQVSDERRSRAFSLQLDENRSGPVILSYDCFACLNDARLSNSGFFSESGVVASNENATDLTSLANLSDLSFELAPAKILSGTISRYDNADLSEAQTLRVFIQSRSTDNVFFDQDSTFLRIEPGRRSANFVVGTSQTDRNEYRIGYECFNCGATRRYYSINGMTADPELATIFTGAAAETGLDLMIVKPRLLGGVVRRVPSLSDSQDLQLRLSVYAVQESPPLIEFLSSDSVSVAAGQESAEFQFQLDPKPNSNISYVVGHSCEFSCDGVSSVGFLTESGTSTDEAQATRINADVDTLDLEYQLIPSNVLSGEISLAEGDVVEFLRFIDITVSTFDTQNNFIRSTATDVSIAAGQFSAPYRLDLPPEDNVEYEVRFNCSSCEISVGSGWYNPAGTALTQQDGARISSIDSLENINIQLLKALRFSGEIIRPSGADNSKRISPDVSVVVFDNTGDQLLFDSAFSNIRELQDRDSFEFYLPPFPDSTVELSYNCIFCDGVEGPGYKTQGGTSASRDESTKYPLIADINGIELVMLEASFLRGSITRPASLSSMQSLAVIVEVDVRDVFNSSRLVDKRTTRVVIPAGADAVDYEVQLPLARPATYSLGYFSDSPDIASVPTNSGIQSLQFISGDDLDKVDIQLQLENDVTEVFAGTIKRPAKSLGQSLNVRWVVESYTSDYQLIDVARVNLDFEESEREKNVDARVAKGELYRVSYDCLTFCRELGIAPFGTLADNGQTVNGIVDSFLTQAGGNLQIQLIDAQELSGIVRFPRRVNDRDLLQISALAVFDNGLISGGLGFDTSVLLSSGETQKNFSIINASSTPRPQGVVGYVLRYTCNCSGLLRSGFVTDDGVSSDRYAATLFSATASVSNIDIRLPSGIDVSGSVFRPQGASTLDALNVLVEVVALDDAGLFVGSNAEQVTIAAGDQSARFTVTSLAESGSNFIVSARCEDCGDEIAILSYYTYFGSSATQNGATRLRGSQLSRLDLYLLSRETQNVLVSRPLSADTTSSIELMLFVEDLFGRRTLDTLVIPAGQSAFTASLPIDLLLNNEAKLGYVCISCPTDIADGGFYSDSGTVSNRRLAKQIGPNSIRAISEFPLLGTQIVSSRLVSDSPLESERQCRVSLRTIFSSGNGQFFSASSQVRLGPDISSAAFEFFIPSDFNGSLSLSYSCQDPVTLQTNAGYYSINGTRAVSSSADFLNVDQALNLGDFALLEFVTVSGELSIVDGIAFNDSTSLTVSANVRDDIGLREFIRTNSVTFNQDRSKASYQIDVPKGESFIFGFRCAFTCDDAQLLPSGFYSSTGTVLSVDEANSVAVLDDLTGIDFIIEKKTKVQSTITLQRPDTSDISKPVFIELTVWSFCDDDDCFRATTKNLEIPANQVALEVPLEIIVPRIDGVLAEISYRCLASCDGVSERGYYSPLGTMLEPGPQTTLDLSAIDGIVFDLLAQVKVPFDIKIPIGLQSDFPISLELHTEVLSEGGVTQFKQSAVVLANSDQVTGKLILPSASNAQYRFSAVCDENCLGLEAKTYLGTTGATYSAELAGLYSYSELPSPVRFEMIGVSQHQIRVIRPEMHDVEVPIEFEITWALANSNLVFRQQAVVRPNEMSTDLRVNLPDIDALASISLDCIRECGQTGIALPAYVSADQDLVYVRQDANLRTLNLATERLELQLDEGNNVAIRLVAPSNSSVSEGSPISLIVRRFVDDGSLLDFGIQRSIFNVPPPRQSASFVFGVPKGLASTFSLEYECVNCDQIQRQGFLTQRGATFELGAEFFQISRNISFTTFLLGLNSEDSDSDGVPDSIDNCPDVSNSSQADLDSDLIGDLCDEDADNDSVIDRDDSNALNPRICSDVDRDQCDDCSSLRFNPLFDGLDTDGDGMCNLGDNDDDGDGIPDAIDNCPLISHEGENPQTCVISDEVCFPVRVNSTKHALICL